MDFEKLLIGAVIIGVAVLMVNMAGRMRKKRAAIVHANENLHPVPVRVPQSLTVEPVSVLLEPSNPAIVEAELREKLLHATTPEGCWEVYENAEVNSLLEEEAYRKFLDLARNELEAAESVDDCKALLELLSDKDSTEINELEKAADEKALNLVNSTEEAMVFYDEYEGDEEGFADRILAKALALAKTTHDADSVYQETEDESELEQAAMAKMLELSETVEDCRAVWDEHDIDSDFGKLAILRAAEIIRAEPMADGEPEETE